MQTCAHCGFSLQNTASLCPRCGQRSSTPIMDLSDYNTPTTPAFGQNSASFSRTGFNYQNYPDYNTQQPRYYQIPPSQVSTLTYPPPRRPEPKTPKLLIAVVITLSLLLIGTGAALLYHTTVTRPAELRAQATATVKAIRTANAHATATTASQTTSTAVAQANATSTVVAHATAEAKATATAQQNVYTKNTKGAPFLNNALDIQTDAGWDLYPTEDGGGCTFSESRYQASVHDKNYYTPCMAHETNFANFALEVTMTIIEGDEGGVIFRSNNQDRNFYSFRIKSDGNYSLVRTKEDSKTVALINDTSSAIKKGHGKSNVLSIIAQGGDIYLYINKQFVGSANDITYRAGSIGFLAIARNSETDVAFSNLRVWKH